MNQQEFYDLVKQAIDKLEAQGVPAKEDDSPRCWYHIVKNGVELRCIVGHMMPLEVAEVADGEIGTIAEHMAPLEAARDSVYAWVDQFTPEQVNVLCDLQVLHDDVAPENFALAIQKMREVLESEQSTNPV